MAQSNLAIINAGAPALELATSAQPSWLAVDGVSTVLAREDHGLLVVPLSVGAQQVNLQHRQRLDLVPGFATGVLELPGLGAMASRGGAELRYGQAWTPLYEAFGSERRVAGPTFGDVLMMLFIGLW
jgi:hypothetical protein